MGNITARTAAAGIGGRGGDQGGKDKSQDGNQFFHRVECRFACFDAASHDLFEKLEKISAATADSNLPAAFPWLPASIHGSSASLDPIPS
jgi:hypothetical protein